MSSVNSCVPLYYSPTAENRRQVNRMWPWGHLAFGYVLYSLYTHIWNRKAPSGRLVVVLAFSTQLPDLVDKPLSWTFGIFPSGYSIAHSIFVATPVIIGFLGAMWYINRSEIGMAFGIGYGSHLLSDLLVAIFTSGATVGRVLWPLITQPAYDQNLSLSQRLVYYLVRYPISILQGENLGIFFLQSTFVFIAVGLWLYDGAPGYNEIRRILSRIT